MSQENVVCVLGMHRSGTSMVTELLYRCGYSVGNEGDLLPASPDNPSGYWENERIVNINKALLEAFGGSWERPPQFPSGWETSPEVSRYLPEARSLLTSAPRFVYKDPRTCLTLPFWQVAKPNQSFVIVVRHPDEIAQSLTIRRQEVISREQGMNLYATYYRAVEALVGKESVIVTNNLAFFYDPHAELKRVLDGLGQAIPNDEIARAASVVQADLRHGFVLDAPDGYYAVPAEAAALYARLCQQCGPVYEKLSADATFMEAMTGVTQAKLTRRLAKLEQLYVAQSTMFAASQREHQRYRSEMPAPIRLAYGVVRRLRGKPTSQ